MFVDVRVAWGDEKTRRAGCGVEGRRPLSSSLRTLSPSLGKPAGNPLQSMDRKLPEPTYLRWRTASLIRAFSAWMLAYTCAVLNLNLRGCAFEFQAIARQLWAAVKRVGAVAVAARRGRLAAAGLAGWLAASRAPAGRSRRRRRP